jgi:hypothetical protein
LLFFILPFSRVALAWVILSSSITAAIARVLRGITGIIWFVRVTWIVRWTRFLGRFVRITGIIWRSRVFRRLVRLALVFVVALLLATGSAISSLEIGPAPIYFAVAFAFRLHTFALIALSQLYLALWTYGELTYLLKNLQVL